MREWKLTTSVILVSALNLTGLTFIKKPYDTFINPNRYARPPHPPIICVFDQLKVKLINPLSDSGSVRLVPARSGKSSVIAGARVLRCHMRV